MLNELLELKAEAEHDLLYAQAKLEVVGKLLDKIDKPSVIEPELVEEYTEEVETPDEV